MIRQATLVLIGCAVLALAGCGGDDDGETESTDSRGRLRATPRGRATGTAGDDDTDDTTAARRPTRPTTTRARRAVTSPRRLRDAMIDSFDEPGSR